MSWSQRSHSGTRDCVLLLSFSWLKAKPKGKPHFSGPPHHFDTYTCIVSLFCDCSISTHIFRGKLECRAVYALLGILFAAGTDDPCFSEGVLFPMSREGVSGHPTRARVRLISRAALCRVSRPLVLKALCFETYVSMAANFTTEPFSGSHMADAHHVRVCYEVPIPRLWMDEILHHPRNPGMILPP